MTTDPIQTHHCRFCSHLLLSTTQDITKLLRRADPALDKAIILPLTPSNNETKHVTLLLSTIADRRATLLRREDGIEKRILLRCGRCRVVVGYHLDKVHWDNEEGEMSAVYVLPGALVKTEDLGGEGVGEGEWRGWSE